MKLDLMMFNFVRMYLNMILFLFITISLSKGYFCAHQPDSQMFRETLFISTIRTMNVHLINIIWMVLYFSHAIVADNTTTST